VGRRHAGPLAGACLSAPFAQRLRAQQGRWRTGAARRLSCGIPRSVLLCARGGWHGLAIELKTAKGHTSPMQDVWLDNLRKEGYFVAVCRGAVEAVHAIERYLEMNV
jgi:hypothetical protein